MTISRRPAFALPQARKLASSQAVALAVAETGGRHRRAVVVAAAATFPQRWQLANFISRHDRRHRSAAVPAAALCRRSNFIVTNFHARMLLLKMPAPPKPMVVHRARASASKAADEIVSSAIFETFAIALALGRRSRRFSRRRRCHSRSLRNPSEQLDQCDRSDRAWKFSTPSQ